MENADDLDEIIHSSEPFIAGESEPEKHDDENDRILSSLFSNPSVHSALAHDKVMGSMKPEQVIVEREASKVAEDAIRALKQDRKRIKRNEFTATWTGKSGSIPRPDTKRDSAFILNKLKGLSSRPTSSNTVVPIFKLDPTLNSNTPQGPIPHQDLAESMRNFLKTSGGPVLTVDLVRKFKSGSSMSDSAVFRNLLRSIAIFDKLTGSWSLKEDFT